MSDRTRATLRRLGRRLPRPLLVRTFAVFAALVDRLVHPRAVVARDDEAITFVIWNVASMGGTVRTVLRQAEALAERGHQVHILSVVRHRWQAEPFFAPPPGVQIEVLVDRRPERVAARGRFLRAAEARPAVWPQLSLGREQHATLATDLLIAGRLRRTRGVIVGTRIGLNLAIAQLAHPRARRIAQEHLSLEHYRPRVRRAIRRHFRDLDVVAVLTEHDARIYRDALDGGPPVVVIPNGIPDQLPPRSPLDTPVVLAVGRLTKVKGFDLLIDAFTRVAGDHPDWRLRIIGEGTPTQRARLERQIADSPFADRIEAPGAVDDVDAELRRSAIFALSSRFESFGIVLLEALASGVPVVAFGCPVGPRELLTDEVDALVTEPGDVAGFATRLDRLMRDAELRDRLASGGRTTASGFGAATLAERWEPVLLPG